MKIVDVSSKNGLFEFYVKIVAEAIRFIETTSSSSKEKTLQRKKFFRIEIATRFIENSLFDQGRNSDFALEFHVEMRFRLFFSTKMQ